MIMKSNQFHIVDLSPWPFALSIGALAVFTGLVSWVSKYTGMTLLCVSLVYSLVVVLLWLRDVIREGTYEGQHTKKVQLGLKLGFILFVLGEAVLFGMLIGVYLWFIVGAELEGIEKVKAWEIPLLNTVILLVSGASLTYAHEALLGGRRQGVIVGMVGAVSLGLLFIVLQAYEYMESKFAISDSVYGSIFYMLTGFHGMHVLLGSIMLAYTLMRVVRYEQTKEHSVGFDISAWYWHFVDVVWLVLFIVVYEWG